MRAIKSMLLKKTSVVNKHAFIAGSRMGFEVIAPLTMKTLCFDMMPCVQLERHQNFLESSIHLQRADSILQSVATSVQSSATLSFMTCGLQCDTPRSPFAVAGSFCEEHLDTGP